MSREKTWFDLRLEFESRVRGDAREAEMRSRFKAVDKTVNPPKPHDSVDLGPRCEWSDLHKSSCWHCKGIDDNDFPIAEEAV
ncbi:hypothetical protein [Puerhibacterium puerhi]|uniref:hypothetical protein n=1 Tax=Puerhibacterium puerhi TaxID=2692623 RepID=UPI001358D6F2|nr:hypothetical protein [Puerhibacterium puerhi]